MSNAANHQQNQSAQWSDANRMMMLSHMLREEREKAEESRRQEVVRRGRAAHRAIDMTGERHPNLVCDVNEALAILQPRWHADYRRRVEAKASTFGEPLLVAVGAWVLAFIVGLVGVALIGADQVGLLLVVATALAVWMFASERRDVLEQTGIHHHPGFGWHRHPHGGDHTHEHPDGGYFLDYMVIDGQHERVDWSHVLEGLGERPDWGVAW